MSTSRSRRSARAVSARPAAQAPKRPIDPSSHSLPGTALHRLALIVGEASRGLHQRQGADDGYLHLRNPLEVAKDVKRRILSLGPVVQKRVASRIAPHLVAPRTLPLGLIALLVGLALVATQRYWASPLLAYGAVALLYNSLIRRRFQRHLLIAVDDVIKADLQLLNSDRTKAEAISGRFADTRNLDFLEAGSAPSGLSLPQGERVLLSADRVLKARETKAGLLKEGEGKLFATTARLLFLAGEQLSEIDLTRIVRADVVDELRLVVIPSKREAPGNYVALGNAHAFAEVIRLARQDLSG